jgi:enoyl-CoA hydratase
LKNEIAFFIRRNIPMDQEMLLLERMEPIAKITLNRPKSLNALNSGLMKKLADELEGLDRDEAIRVIVLTGSEKAFAAGADIKELSETKPVDFVMKQFFRDWERIRKISKPLIAAVNGYALGGGNELAMCCDMIIASDTAQFGQPEILLGVIPGAGGTQRLTKAVGTKKAMEMILTGKSISAEEALQWRLINRVVPAEDLEKEALSLAKEIAEKPPVAVRLAKQAVLKAQELPLEHGLNLEQNAFFLLFSSEDQSEGMRAFLEKRKPEFRGE